MKKIGIMFAALLIPCLSAPAHAQATRTWVSGVGDDANPCSRTAPCKTFAGAISKTAAGGEINCLDSGGFGAVTITKSISIQCNGVIGGILASGVNGIIINGANIVVYLSGLDINGVGTGLNGIRFIQGSALHVENSVIRGFSAGGAGNQNGILFSPSTIAELTVSDTTIADNTSGAIGSGIEVRPPNGGAARVNLRRLQIQNNANNGVRLDSTGNNAPSGLFVSIDDSEISGNTNGVVLVGPAGSAVSLAMIDTVSLTNNQGTAIQVSGTQASGRVSNTTIVNNGTGLSTVGGNLRSFGTNRLNGNGTDGAFTAPVIPQQ